MLCLRWLREVPSPDKDPLNLPPPLPTAQSCGFDSAGAGVSQGDDGTYFYVLDMGCSGARSGGKCDC
jgi:hypothetical protein